MALSLDFEEALYGSIGPISFSMLNITRFLELLLSLALFSLLIGDRCLRRSEEAFAIGYDN